MTEIHTDSIGELRIVIEPRWGIANYIGTRMQLEVEGIVPSSFEWPDGFRRYDWEADGLNFTLVRERPAGAKGARRMFFDCDNWRLSMQQQGSYGDVHQQRQIRLRERELGAIKHRATPAGEREWRAMLRAVDRAHDDKAFQAFKALMPCLTPPPGKRRGRPPRGEVNHG
ncbi:hypothetical protein GIY62_14620 [Burkholderia plantarii]|uniref:hypothetical protein n=1 Tax=Burkholderia plantarii TaxID=41899 RepID=UPI002729A8F6|nr:hypothetical protein [Burkholderia plantarii]WLE58360.1 hypothetical protein GIY62_14620 [Burkholderia plantarii]